jgi:hypothetical protein
MGNKQLRTGLFILPSIHHSIGAGKMNIPSNSNNYRLKEILFVSFLGLFCFLLFPNKVYAYIDPSSGSLALQVLLGLLVGGLVSVKIFWSKILSWFKKLTKHQGKNESTGK